MNTTSNTVRRLALSGARSLAYSTPSRNIARRLVEDPSAFKVREYLEKKGHGHKLRRLASQQLPDGMYFAKLTIKNWTKHRNESFRLLEGENVVYGNKIEPPARGFELEYRNIIVTSDTPEDFSLDISADYSLLIGRGAFTTAQQQRYDEQYSVEQHGDLFYSLRGNTRNPKRILITFPGFGPSTSRISYAVSYLKGITDEDLKDTLMVCFQDRYLAAGSYMLTDNAGNSLRPRVHEEISRLLSLHSVNEKDVMFFGASKGGSIATIYADGFPRARLLAVVPQMNLPYYLDKPFFRDNLYRLDAVRSEPQPETLMRKYFSEGRKVDYFYTDRDEESNHSLIEFVSDVPGLTKYRVDGEHAQVAKKALPTVLTLMKQFARGSSGFDAPTAISCDQATPFRDATGMGVQIRLSNASKYDVGPQHNVLLSGNLGRTQFRQLLAHHQVPFIKYTKSDERLREDLHPDAEVSSLLVTTNEGEARRGDFPALRLRAGSDSEGSWNELDLTPSDSPREYSLLASTDAPISTFRYTVVAGSAQGNYIRVAITEPGVQVSGIPQPEGSGEPRITLTASTSTAPVGIAKFVHRVAIAAGLESVHVVVTDSRVPDSEVDEVRFLYGPEVLYEEMREPSAAKVSIE